MKYFKLLLILVVLTTSLHAQNTSDEYWKAIGIAMKYYDNADYTEASAAFEKVWLQPNDEEIANHRLYAAAANCMIDNEEGVRQNLLKIVDVATKDDMKRVLVNYEIFNKYKTTDWWAKLDEKLDQRLENLIAHHKNLKVFKKGRDIVYSAIRINPAGDTIANTYITIIPDGTGWGDEAASSQSQVIYEYDYSQRDSIEHIEELHLVVHQRFWNKRDTTGVIENSKKVWIHPFRSNEFFKTELAPFPMVKFPLSDSLMQASKSKIVILNNWGSYTKTETQERYAYLGKEKKYYNGTGEIDCHKLEGTGENTKFGISKIVYFFNEDFGFTEMNYLTYDGDRILFKIKGVKNEETF